MGHASNREHILHCAKPSRYCHTFTCHSVLLANVGYIGLAELHSPWPCRKLQLDTFCTRPTPSRKAELGVCCHRNGMFLRCCDRHTALQSSAERRSATAHHFAQAPHAAWEVLPRIATANVLWLNILLVLLPAYRQVA